MVASESSGLDLLVIQPTSLCNLDCRYCYVPDRQNPERVPIPVLEKLFRAVKGSSVARDQEAIDVLWHAGEPLAAGIDFFRQALSAGERILGSLYRLRHSIQTNGTLVTPEWCRLFRDAEIAIGVSIDGPAELHDANRKALGGGGSFRRVIRGVELLRAHGIQVNTLAVLNSENILRPDEMFHFFFDHQLSHVAFNVEEIEGPHLRSSLLPDASSLRGVRSRYRSFMARIAELNRLHGWPLRIREFVNLAHLIQKLRESPTQVPNVPEQRLGAILTMARDGTIYTWSPELASGFPGASNRFSLGNICDVQSVDELLSTHRAVALQREIDKGVEMCRDQCMYFGVCGGGSPANKVYERGTFAATETLKCVLQPQELVEVILSTFPGQQRTGECHRS